MAGPSLADESADDDRRIREGDERGDDMGAAFGADGQLLEAAVVPGVGALNDPTGAGLQGKALDADHGLAAQFLQQLTGDGAVVAGVQVHRDLLGQPDPEADFEPAQLL